MKLLPIALILATLFIPYNSYAKGSWEHERDEYGFIKSSISTTGSWDYSQKED